MKSMSVERNPELRWFASLQSVTDPGGLHRPYPLISVTQDFPHFRQFTWFDFSFLLTPCSIILGRIRRCMNELYMKYFLRSFIT